MLRCAVDFLEHRLAVAANPESPATGLLGDTPDRDYARKLRSFNRFAEPELREAIGTLQLRPGMRVLDAGCGTGETLSWLDEAVRPGGSVTGIDLSAAHVAAARRCAVPGVEVLQGDLNDLPFPAASVDLVWCVNTINHFREPLATLASLVAVLAPGGRIALGQSSLLPEMFFAWDSRLERRVTEAVRRYYRERYRLDEGELAGVRAIAGLLRQAGLHDVHVRTFSIDRLSPLDPASRDYVLQTLFRETWGERLRPHLGDAEFAELQQLCDPGSAHFALTRPDFHFIQTFTLAVGTR